jgi:glycosyltransferase involved in cell wall biosynthesis
MPCLNESETIGQCIKNAKIWVSKSQIDTEILVADNGSIDGSQLIAKRLGARVINVKTPGYGAALNYGISKAHGDFIIMGDSDMSYDFSKLGPFVEKYLEGYDLVMGNRFLGEIHPGAMPWMNKYIGNPALTFIGKFLFNIRINDFHCGLRGLSKKAFRKIDLRTTGMEFASEMVIKSKLCNLKITEVPIVLSKDGRSRPPHLKPWRDGWRHLRFMLLFSPDWLFLFPGALLFIFSLVSYFFILFDMVKLGNIVFGLHTLFYVQSGVIAGLITLSYGILIKSFAIREGLLKKDSFIEKIKDYPILEIGGLLGLIMIFISVLIGLNALYIWSLFGFLDLRMYPIINQVSISSILFTSGFIVLFFSLAMGLNSLPIKSE